KSCITSIFLIFPLGFSIKKYVGFNSFIKLTTCSNNLKASHVSSVFGVLVPLIQCLPIAATLNFSQGGDAQITSGLPNLSKISSAVILEISAYQSMSLCCVSYSILYVSCPSRSNARATLLVPANKSSIFSFFFVIFIFLHFFYVLL